MPFSGQGGFITIILHSLVVFVAIGALSSLRSALSSFDLVFLGLYVGIKYEWTRFKFIGGYLSKKFAEDKGRE